MKDVLIWFAITLNISSLVIMFADWINYYSIIMSLIGMVLGLIVADSNFIKKGLILSFIVVVAVVVLGAKG